MRIGYILGYSVICFVFNCHINVCVGQEIEHNYKVEPQFTSCDSLVIQDLSLEQAINLIRDTNFRIRQSFKLTRQQGFKGGEYFSCDGKIGFLIIKYPETEFLFQDVKKEIWQALRTSRDPEGYFLEKRESLLNVE